MFFWSLPIVLLTGYAAWTDYQNEIIDDWVVFLVLVYGLFITLFLFPFKFEENITYTMSMFIFLFAIYIVTGGGLGGGDIKLVTALTIFYGSNSPTLLLIAGVFAFLYFLIKGIKDRTYLNTQIIFAPSIFLATIITSIFLSQK